MQARLLSKVLTLALLVAVPVLAIAFLGSPFTTANAADASAPSELALPAPAALVTSEPVASVKGETQGETVLNGWTYTGRPTTTSR